MNIVRRPSLLLSIAAALVIILGPLVPAADDAADDGKLLEGTWLPLEAKIGDGGLTKEQLAATRLQIKADGYVVTAGEVVDRGTWKIDPKAKPKTMDITGQEGPNKDKTFLCIYELADDFLTVAYCFNGKDRPAEFQTGGDISRAVIKYQRMK